MATGRNEIVYYSLHRNSKEITITSEMIINADRGYIEYEKEKDSNKYSKINISYSGTYVLYNGKHMVGYDSNILMPEDGVIKAIDNDLNGIYEILIIISFNYRNNSYNMPAFNIVVDYIEVETETVYCRFNSKNNIAFDDLDANYRFVYSGDIKKLSDLKKNMIVAELHKKTGN